MSSCVVAFGLFGPWEVGGVGYILMPLDQSGKDQMSLVVAVSRMLVAQFFFLCLHSLLKKFRLLLMLVWMLGLNSPVVFWYSWCRLLALATCFTASFSSWSHHGFALVEGLLSFAVAEIALWMDCVRIWAYSSNCSSEGSSFECSRLSGAFTLSISVSKALDHSFGSVWAMLYLIPSMFSISCLPLSMVNLIVLWSESWEIEGSIA